MRLAEPQWPGECKRILRKARRRAMSYGGQDAGQAGGRGAAIPIDPRPDFVVRPAASPHPPAVRQSVHPAEGEPRATATG